ncbi:MAG TPA: NUDIX hydrolase [Allosphingosinicella sp.]|nr:NUDIX hydrolase [Allosphingosinicella sp.]
MLIQYGTLPLRRGPEGAVELLLVTSRDTGRWVVPRGNPIRGLAPHQSAAQEAWEEAGVRGAVSDQPLGRYRYKKRRKLGFSVRAQVQLFEMLVTEVLEDWPERHQRRRAWFAPVDAAAAVDEPELKALILAIG